MKKITKFTNTAMLLSTTVFLTVMVAARSRFQQIERDDRGDVPGWAISSAAACVLAAVVYAAYSGVINKWVGKIQ